MLPKEVTSGFQHLAKSFTQYKTSCSFVKKRTWNPSIKTHVCASNFCSNSSADAPRASEVAAKPFSSIPCPPRLPLIGHLHYFIKPGPYSFEKLYDAYHDLHHKYGPILRLDMGIKIVALFSPSDVEKLLRIPEGQYPARPILGALKKYRLSNKKLYPSGGLFTENGPEWYRLRKAVQWIMKPQFAATYIPAQEEVAESFINRIRNLRNNRLEIPNFLYELYRFTEEAVGIVCFGTRLGLVETSDTERSRKGLKMIKSVDKFLQSLVDTTLSGELWKYFNTPSYRKLGKSQDYITKFATECLLIAKAKFEADPDGKDENVAFLRQMITNNEVTMADITLLMIDIFTAGIDTTANSLGFLLYNLSKRPDIQEKLFQEMQRHEISSKPITAETLEKLKLLKACMKENYRLNPPSGGTARILPEPAVLSGYYIPKNITCIALHPTICRQKEHFEDPLAYRPERWINCESGEPKRTGHPYCVLPFGHGSRRCIGQRFAEQETRLCAIKIIQNFKIEYDGPEVGVKMKLNLTPDKPLNFRFIDRK